MARLIDADALMKQIESPYTEYPIMIHLRRAIKDFIDSAPTIDAVSVVRCRECIHFDGFNCNRFGEPAECSNPCSDDGNDFCSYGERRTDE